MPRDRRMRTVIWILAMVTASRDVCAGEVITRDGKVHRGAVKMAGEKVLVGEREFGLADVAKADFTSAALAEPRPGHGLRGEYFAGRGLSKLVFVRDDPQIAYEWGETSPHSALTPAGREFSVRWRGKLRAPANGTYQLFTTTDDGVRVWLDGRLVIDKWFDQSAGEHSAEVKLEAGNAHDLKVEYYNGTGRAAATLSWSGPNLPRQALGNEQQLLAVEGTEANGSARRILLKTPAANAGPASMRVLRSDRAVLRGEYF